MVVTGLVPVQTWEMYPNVAVIALGLVLGGAAAPDMDAKGASASRSFGPLTGAMSFFLRGMSQIFYRTTRGDKDPKGVGAHRLLTHTAMGALMAGGILAAVCAIPTAYGPIPAAIALGLYAGIGTFTIKNNRKLYGVRWKWWAAIVVGAIAYRTHGVDSEWLLVWAGALSFGCSVHCFGDSCTMHGTPFWWPLESGGKRWKVHHVLPEGMRIITGKRGEPIIMGFTYLLTVGACGLVIWWKMRG